MEPLLPHASSPPRAVRSVHAAIVPLPDGKAMVRYRVEGIELLLLPPFAGRGRQDELWRTTCFELFVRGPDGAYREFNFAPSGRWAAYGFEGYRAGMAPVEPEMMPDISLEVGETMLVVNATIAAAEFEGMSSAALTAVMEEEGGHLSYWALAHPPEAPDFHDPACFAMELGAAA